MRLKPATAAWEVQLLPLGYVDPPPLTERFLKMKEDHKFLESFSLHDFVIAEKSEARVAAAADMGCPDLQRKRILKNGGIWT